MYKWQQIILTKLMKFFYAQVFNDKMIILLILFYFYIFNLHDDVCQTSLRKVSGVTQN